MVAEDGRLKFETPSQNMGVRNFTLTVGKTYRFSFEVDKGIASNVYYYMVTATNPTVTVKSTTSTGSASMVSFVIQVPQNPVNATATTVPLRLSLNLGAATPGAIIFIDNFRITEITANFTAGLKPDVQSYSDYYPFGMLVPGRYSTANDYRYGFQGQEKDNEIKGEGNSLNYTFRMHDPRIGRFFAIDPLTHDYPYYSPYQFSGNRVIDRVELEGLEPGPIEAKTSLGENQVHYQEYSVPNLGGFAPASSYKKVVPEGKPISSTMTETELYQFAAQRYLKEGAYKVAAGYYVDEKLQEAEGLVSRFFNNNAPNWQHDQTVSATVHTLTMTGLFSNMKADNMAAVEMVQKADDFSWNYSWLDLLPIEEGASALKLSLNKIYRAGLSRAKRATTNEAFKSGWATASLIDAIKLHGGNKPKITLTDSGKVLYLNEATGVRIVNDPYHKYFRIENTKLSGKRNYLDLDGNVPTNVIEGGRTRGRNQAEYNQATHFNSGE